jgi:hypothetical protein
MRLAKRDGLCKAKVAVARKLAVILPQIVRCLASARNGDRAFNIDPPTSSYAMMRRACPPTAERTVGPGMKRRGRGFDIRN